MLKLQTGKDGKIDITFAEDSGLSAGKIKRAALNTSSAGRRKSKELHQSHVLPKKSNKQVKVTKSLDLKHQNGRDTTQKGKGEALQAKRTNKQENRQIKQTGKAGKGRTGVPGSDAKQSTKPVNTDVGVITQNNLDTLLQALKGSDLKVLSSLAALQTEVQNEGTVKQENENLQGTESGAVSSSHSLGQTKVYDSSLYDKWSRTTNQSVETKKVAASEPSQIIEDPPKDSQTAQPLAMTSTFKIGAPGVVTYDHAQQLKERQRKWREELDEQVREKQRIMALENSRSVQQPKNISVSSTKPKEAFASSQVDPPPQSHPQPAAMASSFAVGAPGLVVYDLEEERRTRQRQYLQEIREQMKEKQFRQSIEQKESPRQLPKEVTRPQSDTPRLEAAQENPYIGDTRPEINRVSFGRRNFNPKDATAMEKLDQEREKHLQHQRAIQEQVEEKRRQKMEERQRRIQEELEEERKLAREREELNRQHEEEKKKQREKEEAERQRLQMLQERVRQAYESAQRDKVEARLRKLKAGGHDISKLEEKHPEIGNHAEANSFPDTHRDAKVTQLDLQSISGHTEMSLSSTRSTKENRPVVNWGSSPDEDRKGTHSNESKRVSRQSDHKIPNRSRKTPREDTDKGKEPDTGRKENDKQNNRTKLKMKDIGKRVNEKSQKQENHSSRKNADDRDESVMKNIGDVLAEAQNEDRKTKTPISSRSKPTDTSRHGDSSTRISEIQEAVSDSTIPYVRSKTVALKQEQIRGDNDVGDERTSQSGNEERDHTLFYAIHRTPTIQLATDSTNTKDYFTPRQQQILEQLQSLRTGLMKKRKEYERKNSA